MSPPANIYVAIVDDDESVGRALGRLLRVSGFQPITYLSAEAFLADVSHPAFDCLVLDINFADMSGIELSRRLTASGSQTPVIFMTAQDDPDVREQAIAAGCAAFLRKPNPGSVVVQAIREAIALGA